MDPSETIDHKGVLCIYEERLERLKSGIRQRKNGAIMKRDSTFDESPEFWRGFITCCEVILSDDV